MLQDQALCSLALFAPALWGDAASDSRSVLLLPEDAAPDSRSAAPLTVQRSRTVPLVRPFYILLVNLLDAPLRSALKATISSEISQSTGRTHRLCVWLYPQKRTLY